MKSMQEIPTFYRAPFVSAACMRFSPNWCCSMLSNRKSVCTFVAYYLLLLSLTPGNQRHIWRINLKQDLYQWKTTWKGILIFYFGYISNATKVWKIFPSFFPAFLCHFCSQIDYGNACNQNDILEPSRNNWNIS